MKKILLAVSTVILSLGVEAQNSTNSPYSRYGYGQLASRSNGATKAMNGLSKGWREGNQVNFANPASYSGIDSLTFLFDAGVSGQITSFQEGNRKLNAKNGGFDYFMGAFRLMKHVGIAFGAVPYSNIGYDYKKVINIGNVPSTGNSATTSTEEYSGKGGLQQAFIGIGVEPLRLKNTSLSLGVNASYFWGDYTKGIINTFNKKSVTTTSRLYEYDTKAFTFDFGAQLQQKFGKYDKLTLGATFAMKQKLSGDPKFLAISRNTQTGVADTTLVVANGSHSLPMTIGAGLVWNHADRIKVGFDYELQKWSDIEYPVYAVVNNKAQYQMTKGLFTDRTKYTFGGEYCHNRNARSWASRVRYRAGVSYASPYLKINGNEGPKEISASFGVGLPITNGYNNRSYLNVSAQWIQQNAKGLIKENTFCINIGLTFNERWFAKWQVD